MLKDADCQWLRRSCADRLIRTRQTCWTIQASFKASRAVRFDKKGHSQAVVEEYRESRCLSDDVGWIVSVTTKPDYF